MQDNSNLRWPPKNMSAKKKYFTVSHNTQSLSESACTNQFHYLHLHIFLTLAANIPILFTSIPNNITSSVPPTALDIQQFL